MPDIWISTPDEVRALRDQLDAQGKKLVFTNGCFDLLHVGHVRYLRQARALGDALVVALNSDSSVRALKGPTRPVNTEEDRAEIMRALSFVDAVVVFSDERVTKLIHAIKPHIYTKGGDYTVETLNPEERSALEMEKVKIEILQLVAGKSTTATLERVALGEGVSVSGEDAESAQEAEAPLRLGIVGSGHGSNLEAILQAIKEGSLKAAVKVVLSDIEDSRILKIAKDAGVPAMFVSPGSDAKKFAPAAQKELCDHLKRHRVQVVVLAGFMRVVKEPLLTEFKDRIVNIHPSLLPLYKGRNAWVMALEEGDIETGCTVHLVNEEVDGGRILAQTKVPIHIGDNPEKLLARIQEQEHLLLPKVLGEWQEMGLPIG
jgi:formyltetrahydrofolate-dependent phosphoribosylglycinamide formyltransferase